MIAHVHTKARLENKTPSSSREPQDAEVGACDPTHSAAIRVSFSTRVSQVSSFLQVSDLVTIELSLSFLVKEPDWCSSQHL